MRNVYNGFLTVLASVCLVLFIAISARAAEQETVDIVINNEGIAPDIRYVDDINTEYLAKDSKAKLTAVHFWATWCLPCIDELPAVATTAQKYQKKGLKVIAIAIDGRNMSKVKRFFADHKIEGLVPYLDPTQKTPKIARIPGLPGTVFLDKKGNLIARANGPLDWEKKSTVQFIESQLR